MTARGVHFALTESEAAALRAVEDDARIDHIQTAIETPFFEKAKHYFAESDKAWDAMHRALTDGGLSWEGGTYPLNHAVMGGEQLYGNDDYIISLKTPEQVREISAALDRFTKGEFRKRYDAIDPTDYDGEMGDQDFDYTWEALDDVRALYRRAAADGRYVLFTVDL